MPVAPVPHPVPPAGPSTAPPRALVPLRAPGVGKTRLAAVLDPSQRAALAVAMLADVTEALHTGGITEVVVAAGGSAAAEVAHHLGLAVIADPPGCRGLDDALAAATERLGAHHDLLVVAADLPRVSAVDVRAVLSHDAEVVVAPTAAGGTGALLRRPGAAIAASYGPGSARRHLDLAHRAGLRAATVDRDGLFHDVDTFTDLAALHEVEVGRATARLLPRLLGHRHVAPAGGTV